MEPKIVEPNAQVTPAQGQESSSAVQLPENQGLPGAQSTPEALTSDAIKSIVKEVVQGELTAWGRMQQSARDKLESRVKKHVDEVKADFAKAGTFLTDDQLRNIESSARDRFIQDESNNTATPEGVQPQGQPNQPAQAATQLNELNPIEIAAIEALQEIGVTLDAKNPDDAEFVRMIDTSSTPGKWLKSVERAGLAKKAALEKANANPASRMTGGAGNGGTPSNPIANINDPSTLLEMGLGSKK